MEDRERKAGHQGGAPGGREVTVCARGEGSRGWWDTEERPSGCAWKFFGGERLDLTVKAMGSHRGLWS